MTGPTLYLPPPVALNGEVAVPSDIESVVGSLRFDVRARVAEASVTVALRLEGHAGWPVFDLRQDIDTASFDGAGLPLEALRHHDMGAGHDARMRAVEVDCDAGSRHRLDLRYRLGAPGATGARPVEWLDDGVAWDLWMSDLEPGRYLEMWVPANLCHDQLYIELHVEVAGSSRPHVLLANASVEEVEPGRRWLVSYPPHYTSLSPLLVLVPADQVVVHRQEVAAFGPGGSVTVAALADAGIGVDSAAADATAWLSYFAARYGPWAHGDHFMAVIWGAERGMEYDGATTASPAALEHEVFHSWFGRGVKPARASDGWIDEAMATWATASRRAGGGRYGAERLGLDEPPALLCPPHPWARHTPRESYVAGSRLLAGLADMAGGAAQFRSALADWYRQYKNRAATSEDLERHMSKWCGRDLGPWWGRYVYGHS